MIELQKGLRFNMFVGSKTLAGPTENLFSFSRVRNHSILRSQANSHIRRKIGFIKRRFGHTGHLVRAVRHEKRWSICANAGENRANENESALPARSEPHEVGGNSDGHTYNLQNMLPTLMSFLQDQFLPIVLVSSVSIGYAFPEPGKAAHALGLSKLVTAGIFVISGLTLRSEEVLKAAAAWPVWTYGIVAILFLTPLAAIGVLQLPLQPSEFAAGLAVFCCVPTTLTSGVTLSQAAGANSALALALTVGTNVLGIVTMPYVLAGLFVQGSNVRLPPGPLLRSLVSTVLLPLSVGAALRATIPGLPSFVSHNRKAFSMLNNFMLSMVPWMQVSCSRSALESVAPSSLGAAIAAGIAVHLIYLLINTTATHVLLPAGGSSEAEARGVRRAVILVASQKTLPVAAAAVERLGGALGETGLLVLPCIAAHLCQILLDSALVSYWLQQDAAHRKREHSA